MDNQEMPAPPNETKFQQLYKWLHTIVAKIETLLGDWKANNKPLHYLTRFWFWVFVAVLLVRLSAFSQGRLMVIIEWLIIIMALGSAFVYDHTVAKQKGYQLFWKPWFIILLLLGSVAYLQRSITAQKEVISLAAC